VRDRNFVGKKLFSYKKRILDHFKVVDLVWKKFTDKVAEKTLKKVQNQETQYLHFLSITFLFFLHHKANENSYS
jgi:hypothetical protein